MNNFDVFAKIAMQSRPAINYRLNAFNTQISRSFFKSLYLQAMDAVAALPTATQPRKRQGNADKIPPQPRLESGSFNYTSGAPGTLIATQQQAKGGNSGLFIQMGIEDSNNG